jgi:hypothetical protein
MMMRIGALAISATLLSSVPLSTANAQFVICVNDYVGCVSHMQVSCDEIGADPQMQAHANRLCRQRGYSGGSAIYVSGSRESGGQCGRYMWRVNCQAAANPSPSQGGAQQFYVIGRYYCTSATNPNRDEGDCNITTRGNSCPEAMAAQRSTVAQVGDPCRQCAGVTDNSKRWTERVDFNQGGPCQGFR